MVRAQGKDDGGAMNETTAPPTPPGTPPPPPPGSGPTPGGEGPRQGMNTAGLGDYRALRRSAVDRKIAGVAGGLARHLDIDPLLVRVLLVVLAFFGGAGLLLYGVLWLLVPDEKDGHVVVPSDDSTRNVLVIVALVVAGLIALTTGVGGDSGAVWFLCVVAAGALAFHLIRQSRRGAPVPQPQADQWGYAAYAGPSAATDAPAWSGGAGGAGSGGPTDRTWGSWVPPYVPPRKVKRGPLLFLPTLALVAVGLGVLGIIEGNGTAVPDPAYAALALAIVGAMLVVGSVFGRAGGLVLLALVAAVSLAVSGLAEPSYRGSRDLVITPTSTADLRSSYSVPAGTITVDLTKLSEPEALAGRELDLQVNAGEIVVIVPGYVDVDLDAEVRFGGSIDTPDGLTHDGWGTDVERTYDGPPSTTGAPLELDLLAKFGHIDVRRG